MKDHLNLNGFPTDNSPSTQPKYDIMASKFMTGIHNHQKHNAPVALSNNLGLIGAIVKGLAALVVIAFVGCGALAVQVLKLRKTTKSLETMSPKKSFVLFKKQIIF